MKKITVISLVISASFLSGFGLKSVLVARNAVHADAIKVTGIGGIFFKCKDPGQLKQWYHENLGLQTDQYGAAFVWYEGSDSTKKGLTQWTPFPETTRYFAPSAKDFMINYRVQNLAALVAELAKKGVTIVDSIATYDYGKFIHLLDPEGNKIELWEPIP
ncbi:MAG TPA: VOC family protein [Chitinophagaceae bacterium]|jgi:predicted enzyme related to lactoylglutathione lyase|nr:VOC family protein [Chitinophagaceae bacterium]